MNPHCYRLPPFLLLRECVLCRPSFPLSNNTTPYTHSEFNSKSRPKSRSVGNRVEEEHTSRERELKAKHRPTKSASLAPTAGVSAQLHFVDRFARRAEAFATRPSFFRVVQESTRKMQIFHSSLPSRSAVVGVLLLSREDRRFLDDFFCLRFFSFFPFFSFLVVGFLLFFCSPPISRGSLSTDLCFNMI